MKLQFTNKNKAVAEKFAQYIKAERNIDSTIVTKDDVTTVEYSIADYCEKPAMACEKPCHPTYDDLQALASCLFREMQYQVNWLSAELQYLSNALYKHQSNGHLPPIAGADKMAKALTALGIAEDYEIQKPIVWVQASRGSELEVDLVTKK